MVKLKLNEKQKYCLLFDAFNRIISQGRYPHSFLSPEECDRITFKPGLFSEKNGARVEVVYDFNYCRITLLWHYCPIVTPFGSSFSFVPKALTIDREFKNSVLISILDDPESGCYRYQSLKSIINLCVEGTEEGEADAQDGVCHAEADDNTASDVDPFAVHSYHFEDENEHSVIL